jgi:hypothetical protein
LYDNIIFRSKRDEVTGDWRKLHIETLLNLYSSSSIIRVIKSRRMRRTGYVALMGEILNAYNILVEKQEAKRLLGRPRHRWVDDIKMDFRVIGWGGTDLTDLPQDRKRWRVLVNTVMNLRVQ